MIVTEKSFIGGVAAGGRKVYERSVEDAAYRRERAAKRREAVSEKRRKEEEARRLREEELENEKLLRMDKKVSGVMLDTALGREPEKASEEKKVRDDIHEITVNLEEEEEEAPVRERERHSYHYIEQESDELNEIHLEETGEDEDGFVVEEPEEEDGFGVEEPEEFVPAKPMDSYQLQMGNQMSPSAGRERYSAYRKCKVPPTPRPDCRKEWHRRDTRRYRRHSRYTVRRPAGQVLFEAACKVCFRVRTTCPARQRLQVSP